MPDPTATFLGANDRVKQLPIEPSAHSGEDRVELLDHERDRWRARQATTRPTTEQTAGSIRPGTAP
jgi:hypothetical protein